MRVAFVLGTLNVMLARQLAGLKVDCMYHFSAHELSLPGFPVPCYRLVSRQLDALKESAIVESGIERSIAHVAKSGDDAALMRRALRLSELRIEARCYLNAVEFIKRQLRPAESAIESVIFVSHYLQSADVSSFPSTRIYWHQVPHTRFLGMIPGLSRLIFLFQVVGGRKVGRQGNPVR